MVRRRSCKILKTRPFFSSSRIAECCKLYSFSSVADYVTFINKEMYNLKIDYSLIDCSFNSLYSSLDRIQVQFQNLCFSLFE